MSADPQTRPTRNRWFLGWLVATLLVLLGLALVSWRGWDSEPHEYPAVLLASGTEHGRTWAVAAWSSTDHQLCLAVASFPNTSRPTAQQVIELDDGAGQCGFDDHPSDGYSVGWSVDMEDEQAHWINVGPLPVEATGYRLATRTIPAHDFPAGSHLPKARYWIAESPTAEAGWDDGTSGYPVDARGHRVPFRSFT